MGEVSIAEAKGWKMILFDYATQTGKKINMDKNALYFMNIDLPLQTRINNVLN